MPLMLMTKYEIKKTSRFKRDYKLIVKRQYDIHLLEHVVALLTSGESLPEQYLDHALKGNFAGLRECHLTADWLLIYEIDEGTLFLYLTRTGTHADLLE